MEGIYSLIEIELFKLIFTEFFKGKILKNCAKFLQN